MAGVTIVNPTTLIWSIVLDFTLESKGYLTQAAVNWIGRDSLHLAYCAVFNIQTHIIVVAC